MIYLLTWPVVVWRCSSLFWYGGKIVATRVLVLADDGPQPLGYGWGILALACALTALGFVWTPWHKYKREARVLCGAGEAGEAIEGEARTSAPATGTLTCTGEP